MFSPEAIKSNSEDKQNYEMLCMEAMEEIKQRKEHGEQANKELNEVGVQIACRLCCVRIMVKIHKY